ncbi:MAG: hypothetical protein WBB98_13305 [Xanthobacteraceae bacterium]
MSAAPTEIADDLLSADRFEENPMEFVGVTSPTLIYIGVKSRADFDKIDRPCTNHGLTPTGHLLSKHVEGDGVYIVFQHWLKSETFAAMCARRSAKRALRAADKLLGAK